jgi:hypothetical protein
VRAGPLQHRLAARPVPPEPVKLTSQQRTDPGTIKITLGRHRAIVSAPSPAQHRPAWQNN